MLPKHQLIGYHAAMYNSDRFVDSFLTSFSRASRNETGRENTLPKMQDIEKMEELLSLLFFPGRQGTGGIENLRSIIEYNMEMFTRLLHDSIKQALSYEHREHSASWAMNLATEHVDALCEELPRIRLLLKKDAEAGYMGDPAARNVHEVILCYPAMKAITVHRVAHFLFRRGVPLVPRMMNEVIHQRTGIDIHPGAEIGESFFIDHGTGVVIGETTIIGNNVKLYQGVTLGALSIPKHGCGTLLEGVKRHPTIEDNVTIYANATILGDVTIGSGSTIASNAWIKNDIPANSLVITATPEIKVKPKALPKR